MARTSRVAALVWAAAGWGVQAVGQEPPPPLAAVVQPLIDGHRGKVAVAIKHLTSGAGFRCRPDEPMPTTSLIKLAVMIEVYQQAAEGKIKLQEPVTLRDEDKVPGSGILTQHFSAGASIPLRDAVRLMIAYSDNTATNLVLDKIGIASTSARMEAWGFPSLFPERSRQFGLGSTTAGEMIGLVEAIHHGDRIAEADRATMIEHLKRCDDRDKFPRLLPRGTVVAHKTGSVDRSRTDAGIIYTKSGPVAVCVLTDENEDARWAADNAGNLLCARVARAAYDYFSNDTLEASPRP
jgi:beta-lactamase class A